jgi:hypothetical protein
MAKPDGVFLFIGTYPSEAAARADATRKDSTRGAVGTYDAAVSPKTMPAKCTSTRTRDRHGARERMAPSK